MSKAKNFIEYLKNKNIQSFTHLDIVLHTGTTCPHSVLRDMKPILKTLGISLREATERNANNSSNHSRYFIEVL